MIYAVELLTRHGYLVDTTPGQKGKPHCYLVLERPTSASDALVSSSASDALVQELHYSGAADALLQPESGAPDALKRDLFESRKKDSRRAKKAARPEDPPDPRIIPLLVAFEDMLGYPLPNRGAEAKAAKQLLAAGYTPDDALACWRFLQTDSFWADRHCGLMSVFKQVGVWVRAGRPANRQSGRGNHASSGRRGPSWASSDGGYSEEDIDRILAERKREAQAG